MNKQTCLDTQSLSQRQSEGEHQTSKLDMDHLLYSLHVCVCACVWLCVSVIVCPSVLFCVTVIVCWCDCVWSYCVLCVFSINSLAGFSSCVLDWQMSSITQCRLSSLCYFESKITHRILFCSNNTHVPVWCIMSRPTDNRCEHTKKQTTPTHKHCTDTKP